MRIDCIQRWESLSINVVSLALKTYHKQREFVWKLNEDLTFLL